MRAAHLGIAGGLALGLVAAYVGTSSTSTATAFSGGPFGGTGSIAAARADDTLRNPTAEEDLWVNALVLSNRAPDGGPGVTAMEMTNPGCIKGGGTNGTLCWDAEGVLTIGNTSYQQTAFIASPASSPQGSPTRWINAGSWVGEYPQGATPPTCDSAALGGRAVLNDGGVRYCDGTTAHQIGFVLSNTANIDFDSMNSQDTSSKTLTITGALTSDGVSCTPVNGGTMQGTDMHPTVTSADTVTIVAHNDTGGTINPAAMDIKCWIVRP